MLSAVVAGAAGVAVAANTVRAKLGFKKRSSGDADPADESSAAETTATGVREENDPDGNDLAVDPHVGADESVDEPSQ